MTVPEFMEQLLALRAADGLPIVRAVYGPARRPQTYSDIVLSDPWTKDPEEEGEIDD